MSADEVAVADHPRPQSFWSRHRDMITGVSGAIVVALVSRVIVALVIYLGTSITGSGKNMKMALLSWDSGWYYGAATNGYPHVAVDPNAANPQNTIAFFPLYPMTSRLVHDIFGFTILEAGIIVSVLGCCAAAVAIWLITSHLLDRPTANKAVALFCFFPSSIAMMMMMSEGVSIALAAFCLYFLIKHRWLAAGVCAAFATASRPTSLVLCFCCAWACAVALYKHRDWKSLIAPLLSPLGLLAYFLFLWHHTGSFTAWLEVEKAGWSYDNVDHFVSFRALEVLWNSPLADTDRLVTAVSLLVSAVGLVLLARWRRVPMVLVIYTIGILGFTFFTGGPASKLRYVLGAFPMAIAAARWAKGEYRFAILLGSAAAGMGVYALQETHTIFSIL